MRKYFFLSFFIFSLFVFVGEAKTLRVVLDDSYPPYSFFDSSRQAVGICVDLWKEWQKVTGVKVKLILTNWENAIPMVEDGRADVVDEIFYTNERAKKLDFTSAYDTVKTRIFFDKRLSGITTDLSTLKGFDVGVKKGDYDALYLLSHGVKSLIYYPSYDALMQAVKEKKVHIFVMDSSCAFYYLSKYGLLNDFNYTSPILTSKLYRAVKKGNESVLELVKEGFSRISPSFVSETLNKWKGYHAKNQPWQDFGLLLTLALAIGGVAGGLFVWNRVLIYMINKKTRQLNEEIEKTLREKEKVSELADKLNEVTEHLYRVNENMTKMVNLISRFSPFADEKEFAKEVLDLALKLIPEADGGSISVMERDKWVFLATRGCVDEKIMNLDLKSAWMLKVNSVRVVKNIIKKDEDVMPSDVLEKFKEYTKCRIFASLVAPISISGRYTGNIFLDAYSDVDFSPESQHLMGLLSSLASTFFTLKRSNLLDLEHQKEILKEIVDLQEDSLYFMRGHSERVAQFSESIGREMGLSWKELEDLKWCAIFHDIGFIGISTTVREKLKDLTSFSEDEMDIFKTHPILSEAILSFSTLPKFYQDVVRAHHENYDGSGYPDGLREEEIPLFSRIIAVANMFDEMVNVRDVDPQMAIDEINNMGGKIYDPNVVRRSLKTFRDFSSKLRKT